jgi:hypothetical protein
VRAALWAALTGALVAVPETEPGWLWLAGHVLSSVFLAYLLMCLADVAWTRAACALAPGDYAGGGVTITAWTEGPMPPGGDPNMAVLPRQAPAPVREALGVPRLAAGDLVIWANAATWELLDAVDAHLAAADPEEKP